MTHKTSVVIPFYQDEPGILCGAVVSACSQVGVSDLEIIVVDDGSPAPARVDLEGIDLPPHVTISVIEQRNCGPGAARNRGLDKLGKDTVYVAFLDSDDRWTEDHLRNATCMLDQGYDFYFANHWQTSRNKSFFDRNPLPAESVCIDSQRQLYRFMGRATLESNLCPTPTVVYRRLGFDDIRFNEVFVGEDRCFWREITQRTDKIAFSLRVESISGPGVHLCETSAWGTPRAIWRLAHYMASCKSLRESFPEYLPSELAEKQIKRLRTNFVAAVLHEVRKCRIHKNRYILNFVRADPTVLLVVIPIALKIVLRKLRSCLEFRA